MSIVLVCRLFYNQTHLMSKFGLCAKIWHYILNIGRYQTVDNLQNCQSNTNMALKRMKLHTQKHHKMCQVCHRFHPSNTHFIQPSVVRCNFLQLWLPPPFVSNCQHLPDQPPFFCKRLSEAACPPFALCQKLSAIFF